MFFNKYLLTQRNGTPKIAVHPILSFFLMKIINKNLYKKNYAIRGHDSTATSVI